MRGEAEKQAMLRLLNAYEKAGCELRLRGRPCRPGKIVDCYFQEGNCYMPDFIADERGRIKKIDFIRIRK